MSYSIKPTISVKEYGFLSFAKITDTHANKVAINFSNKCSQKFLDGECCKDYNRCNKNCFKESNSKN